MCFKSKESALFPFNKKTITKTKCNLTERLSYIQMRQRLRDMILQYIDDVLKNKTLQIKNKLKIPQAGKILFLGSNELSKFYIY